MNGFVRTNVLFAKFSTREGGTFNGLRFSFNLPVDYSNFAPLYWFLQNSKLWLFFLIQRRPRKPGLHGQFWKLSTSYYDFRIDQLQKMYSYKSSRISIQSKFSNSCPLTSPPISSFTKPPIFP